MKKSPTLFTQHIGWHFYKHWFVQKKRKILKTPAEEILKLKNIPIFKPEDILQEKRVFEKIDIIGYKAPPQLFDNTHPNWHDEILLTFKDHNVPLEGLDQAKIITNTVQVQDGLPKQFNTNGLPKEVDEQSKKIILNTQLFDAEQKKLPIIKDPTRPAWVFPRTYGISQDRKNKLVISKLIKLLESVSDHQLVKQRYLFEDLQFSFPFKKDGNLIQLELGGNVLLSSTKPLSPISNATTEHLKLPNIDPINPFITFNEENIYTIRDLYPIKSTVKQFHPHTIFIHFNREHVKNLYEEDVTENQIFGRSLLKTFTAAASYARKRYGNNVKVLQDPVTLQCVHTDAHFFHLGVLQLNTLDLEDKSVKNVWYQAPLQYLFESCSYVSGKPILSGYDNQIVRQLASFYNNV